MKIETKKLNNLPKDTNILSTEIEFEPRTTWLQNHVLYYFAVLQFNYLWMNNAFHGKKGKLMKKCVKINLKQNSLLKNHNS